MTPYTPSKNLFQLLDRCRLLINAQLSWNDEAGFEYATEIRNEITSLIQSANDPVFLKKLEDLT